MQHRGLSSPLPVVVATGILFPFTGALNFASSQPLSEPGAPVQLERVNVTGTNIRRSDFETPSPLQVIRRDDIERSGYTSVSDLLRAGVSANNSGTLSQAYWGAFAAGASGIALRGMSLNATLVLVDGHRMAPYPLADDGQRSFVDLSSIPLSIVERIEVLKDGASAVYGSDAIAGVVNIILRKQFQGTELLTELGTSQKRDGTTQHVSLTHGFGDRTNDGYSALFNLEYRHQNAIAQGARPALTNLDFRSQGGPDLRGGIVPPGATIPNNGVPTQNGMVAPMDPITRQLLPNAGFQNLPGCAPENLNYSGGCTYNTTEFRQIQPGTQNINATGKLTAKFGGGWISDLTASVSNSRAEQSAFPISVPSHWGNYSTLAIIDQTDPTTSPIVLPIGNPNNPFPNNPAFLNYAFGDVGPVHVGIETNVYRLVGDIGGSAFGWDIDASAGLMRISTERKFNGLISADVLNAVLADGSYHLGASADLNSPSLYARLSPASRSVATSTLQFASARMSREIYRLDGRPLDFSLGGEIRHQRVDDPGIPGSANGELVGVGAAFAHGGQSVQAAYSELSARVTPSLEVNAAVRVDHYNTVGTDVVPRLGFKFAPNTIISVRATYAEGFRAPGTAENGTGAITMFTRLGTDPARCPTTQLPSDCGSGEALLLLSGNPNLKPERSKNVTVGLVIKPNQVTGISLDWYRIRRIDEIAFAPLGSATPIRGAVQSNFPALPGPILAYVLPYVNAASTETTGLDAALRSVFDLAEIGALTVDLSLTHIIRYVQCFSSDACFEYAGTHGPTSLSGNTGTPATRANMQLALARGPVSLGASVNYHSGMKNIDRSLDGDNCLNPWFTACRIGSFTTVDVFGSYRLGSQWTLSAHVQNLFNRAPPFDPQTYGGVNYNPALDQSGAIGRFFQVGARYAF